MIDSSSQLKYFLTRAKPIWVWANDLWLDWGMRR